MGVAGGGSENGPEMARFAQPGTIQWPDFPTVTHAGNHKEHCSLHSCCVTPPTPHPRPPPPPHAQNWLTPLEQTRCAPTQPSEFSKLSAVRAAHPAHVAPPLERALAAAAAAAAAARCDATQKASPAPAPAVHASPARWARRCCTGGAISTCRRPGKSWRPFHAKQSALHPVAVGRLGPGLGTRLGTGIGTRAESAARTVRRD